MNEAKRSRLLTELEQLNYEIKNDPQKQAGFMYTNTPEYQRKETRFRELMDWFDKDKGMTSKQYRKYKQIMKPEW